MQLKQTNNFEVQFIVDEILTQINQRNSIGKISITVTTHNTGIELDRECFPDSSIDIQLSKTRTIHLPGNTIRGGVCILSQSLILCSSLNKLVEVNLYDRNIIQEYKVCHHPKRISYNPIHKSILVSNDGNCLIHVLYDNIILSHNAMKGEPPPNGGVCMHGGYFYATVDTELKKLSDPSSKLLTTCFKTDTDCSASGLNALAVDQRSFMYTTKDFHVRCISVDGKELFLCKDTEEKKINSLVVSARGLIFAVAETGSIHVISENGKKMKTLLSKCVNIKNLSDIWLDESGKTLYVCGDEYIELYDII